MTTDDGIIDIERNPFTKPSWVKQGYRLTSGRSAQIEKHLLIGKTISEIKAIKDSNVGAYLAFVAIRWGFLIIEDDRLVTTRKWDDMELYFKSPKQTKSRKSKSKTVIAPIVPTQKKAVKLKDLESIRSEIERRRKILIDRARDESIQMDPVERIHIIEYLEKENLPQKPDTEVQLLKEFVSSSLSRNRGLYLPRKKLIEFYGEIVISSSLPQCLSKMFSCGEFLADENWVPRNLIVLATKLKEKENDEFRRFLLNLTEQIANVMQNELAAGLENFYNKIEKETKDSPEQAWKFMEQFTKSIYLVGPGLMSDFLKNSGFPYFVKIDHHLKKEFPALLPLEKKSDKNLFIYAWHLCEELAMTPFIFDHIMYQWGKAKL